MTLSELIARAARQGGALDVAAAWTDPATKRHEHHQGDLWFHAASTMKVAVMVGLFDAIDQGRLGPSQEIPIHNDFVSVADGSRYKIEAGRDSNAVVHAALGKSLPAVTLARHMIVTSSNLATNLLVDLVGVEAIRSSLTRRGVDGVTVRRGVEDDVAWKAGINNEVTARGLVSLFMAIHEARSFSPAARESMLDILLAQQFTSGIPAGLPPSVRPLARVAHKTGDISTVAHDAGLVYLPGREPYGLAILTRWHPSGRNRWGAVAAVSKVVHQHLTGGVEAQA